MSVLLGYVYPGRDSGAYLARSECLKPPEAFDAFTTVESAKQWVEGFTVGSYKGLRWETGRDSGRFMGAWLFGLPVESEAQ
jgi:hypothetical protein